MPTDTQCQTAKPKDTPKDKPCKLSDGKGLYLQIKPNGVKARRYLYMLTSVAFPKIGSLPVKDITPAHNPIQKCLEFRYRFTSSWPCNNEIF